MAVSQFKPVIEDVSEADYRAFFDSSVLRVWHLRGKERTYRIVRCARMRSTFRNEERQQPVLYLVDRQGREQLPLALNKTNAATIAQLYGNNPHQWAGKTITLYPTTTEVGPTTRECIRVRPYVPGTVKPSRPARVMGATVAEPGEAEPAAREPGDDADEGDDHPSDERGAIDDLIR